MAGRVVALALVVALAAVAFVGTGRAAAGEPVATISISSVTIPVGEEGLVELRASVAEPPGLGAWTIDVTYDTDAVTATDCDSEIGVCSTGYASDTVRATGGPKGGVSGDVELARFRFQCADRPGTSVLEILISVFADATPGDPQDMSGDTEVVNGEIICAEHAATRQPEVTATPPPGLPSTGGGYGSSGARTLGWATAALVGLGALAVAGARVWARRR